MDLAFLFGMLLLTGALGGLSSGLFGVGGGFVVVPSLLYVFHTAGYNSEGIIFIAIGTSLATIIVASTRAALAHRRLGSLNTEFLRSWLPWLAIGTVLGVSLTSVVSSGELKLIFAVGVAIYSVFFLFPRMFENIGFDHLPTGILRASLGVVIGGISALLGIGGGTPIVITMTLCGRSIVESVGTAAGVGCIIGVLGAIGFMIIGVSQTIMGAPPGTVGFINVPALLAISAVSVITAPAGAKLAHRLDTDRLKRCFGFYLIAVATIILRQTL